MPAPASAVFKAVHTIKLGNRAYLPGAEVPAHHLSDKERIRLLKCGAIRQVGRPQEVEIPDLVLKTEKQDENTPVEQERWKVEAEAPPPPPPGASGKWDHDPKKLKGLPLLALQAIVLETDPKAVPPDSEEAAIAFLSQDYTG